MFTELDAKRRSSGLWNIGFSVCCFFSQLTTALGHRLWAQLGPSLDWSLHQFFVFKFWRLRQLVGADSRGCDLPFRFLEHDWLIIYHHLLSCRLVIDHTLVHSYCLTLCWWHIIRIPDNCQTLLLDLLCCHLHLHTGQLALLYISSTFDFGHEVNISSYGMQRFVNVIIAYNQLPHLVHIIASSSYVSNRHLGRLAPAGVCFFLKCWLPPNEWAHRVTKFDLRYAISPLNFVFVFLSHINPSLCFQLHIIRNSFEHSHLVHLLVSFSFCIKRLQIDAWNPLKEVTLSFQLILEGLDLLPDELGEIPVQTGMHMVELLDTLCWINMHELHLCTAVDGSCWIGLAHNCISEVKHGILEKLRMKQIQEMHINTGSLILDSRFICHVSMLWLSLQWFLISNLKLTWIQLHQWLKRMGF